jgi:Acetyltransferases
LRFIIRIWKKEDYEDIAKLFCQVHNLHQSGRPDFYEVSDRPLKQEDFDELLQNEKIITLAAESEGAIIGFSIVELREPSRNPLMRSRQVAWMEDLCVDEKYRRQGIGKLLFDAVNEEIKSRGITSLELMVWNFNKSAVEFYRGLGMTERSLIMELKL